MKKSIIYLGIALVTFTNVALALDFQQSSNDESLNVAQTAQSTESLEPSSNEGGDPASINPETIVVPTYQKTMEEIIAENNQIIESTLSLEQTASLSIAEDNQIDISIEITSVSSEEAMAERILQDSQIIESTVLNATKKEQK